MAYNSGDYVTKVGVIDGWCASLSVLKVNGDHQPRWRLNNCVSGALDCMKYVCTVHLAVSRRTGRKRDAGIATSDGMYYTHIGMYSYSVYARYDMKGAVRCESAVFLSLLEYSAIFTNSTHGRFPFHETN